MSDQLGLFTVTDTLAEARANLLENRAEGVRCPCCDQFAKEYRRTLPSATARVMVELYRRDEGYEFQFLPDILDQMTGTAHQGGYGTLGHYWGLMEQQPGERDDGSNRVGWWRLTPKGRSFIYGYPVPRYARIYAGTLIGLEGPDWTIQQALGEPFNYRDLMAV